MLGALFGQEALQPAEHRRLVRSKVSAVPVEDLGETHPRPLGVLLHREIGLDKGARREGEALLEARGDVDGARLVHESLTDGAPGLLEAVLAHARFERRCGSREDVLAIYKGALPRLDAGSDARGLVQAALARFQLHVLRDADAARQTLEASIREAPQCRELWVAYYALEASSEDAAAPKRVSALFSAALDDSTQLPAASQKALWSLYLQHVEDLGPEIGHLLEVREAHAGWLRKTGQLA